VIVDQVDLEPRVGGIARVGIAPHHFVHRIERKPGDLLVAADVADLLVIAQADQVIGIGGIAVAGVDRQEPLRRLGRLGVIPRDVIGEGAHQLGTAGPGRIGMLALHLVKQRGGDLGIAAIKPVLGRHVKRIDVARDEGRVLGLVAPSGAAGSDQHGRRGSGDKSEL